MEHEDTHAAALGADPYAAAYPEAAPFWAAAEDGRLLLKACRACGRAHWYPRVICPLCGSQDTHWQAASGAGELHAFSEIVRTAVPYVLAYVRLAEGPVLLTNLIDCDPRALAIGQPVALRMRRTAHGRMAPFFTPGTA